MYSDPATVLTMDLKNDFVLNSYKDMGYAYIRQIHMPYNKILRSPSVGCIVELTCNKEAGSYLLDSPKGRKLIYRISYFGYL